MNEKEFKEEFERNLAKETLYEEWQKKDQRIKDLEKELKKVKQEKKKLSVKNGRYKRNIETLFQTWLDCLCENKSFVSEEKVREALQGYDKDKLIELYLQMRFERDVWRDLEE